MFKLSFTLYRNLLWMWDLVTLNLILILSGIFIYEIRFIEELNYQLLVAVFNICWMAAGYLMILYLSKNWLDFWHFIKRTVNSYILSALGVFMFIFISNQDYSRSYVLFSLLVFGFVLLINRVFFSLLVLSLRKQFSFEKKVVVLGHGDSARRLIEYFKKEAKLVNFAGYFDDNSLTLGADDVNFLGGIDGCMDFVVKNKVSEIYSTLPPERYPRIYEIAKDAEKNFVQFKVVPDYKFFVNRNIFVDFIDDLPVLSLRKLPLEDTGHRIKKRVFDIAFSLFVIVFILSWLTPIIAILIKLESRGPVFFLQLRSGKSNKPFRCIKFRSLRVNDDADQKQVSRGDSRITRIGRFLRKSNIDELPQFINVLLGDMSVVGPRPHMLKHTEDFSHMDSEYMIRHFVKPGITGWAQCHGFRGEITEPELLKKRISHDLWYIENWTLSLDIRIIIMTIFVSIRGDDNAF